MGYNDTHAGAAPYRRGSGRRPRLGPAGRLAAGFGSCRRARLAEIYARNVAERVYPDAAEQRAMMRRIVREATCKRRRGGARRRADARSEWRGWSPWPKRFGRTATRLATSHHAPPGDRRQIASGRRPDGVGRAAGRGSHDPHPLWPPVVAVRCRAFRSPIRGIRFSMELGRCCTARVGIFGRRVIYAAETYAGALLEILVHASGAVPRSQGYVEIEIPARLSIEEVTRPMCRDGIMLVSSRPSLRRPLV